LLNGKVVPVGKVSSEGEVSSEGKVVPQGFESIYKSTLLNYKQSRHWRNKYKEAIEIEDHTLPRAKEVKGWSEDIRLLTHNKPQFEDTSGSPIEYVPKWMGIPKPYLAQYLDYSLFTALEYPAWPVEINSNGVKKQGDGIQVPWGILKGLIQDIIEGIEDGAIVLNHVGHGSIDLWTEEALFDTYILNNQGRYPFATPYQDLTLFGDHASSLMGLDIAEILPGGFESIYRSTFLNYKQSRHWTKPHKKPH